MGESYRVGKGQEKGRTECPGGCQLLCCAGSTIHPGNTVRGTRGIESAVLGTRNAYKYTQSCGAGGRGQLGMGTEKGQRQQGAGCCTLGNAETLPGRATANTMCWPWRGRSGSAVLPRICHAPGLGPGGTGNRV